MTPEPSARAMSALKHALRQVHGGASQLIQPAAGGFVVGLVDPKFGAAPPETDEFVKLMRALGPINAQSAPQDRVVIFTLRFYASETDAYNERAALRVRANSWDEHGHPTHYASAQDAYVLAHEIDAEAMLIDPQSLQACRVIRDAAIETVSAPLAAVQYVQFDLGGQSLHVNRVEDLGSGVWKVYV